MWHPLGPEIEPVPPAIRKHWPTREVLQQFLAGVGEEVRRSLFYIIVSLPFLLIILTFLDTL